MLAANDACASSADPPATGAVGDAQERGRLVLRAQQRGVFFPLQTELTFRKRTHTCWHSSSDGCCKACWSWWRWIHRLLAVQFRRRSGIADVAAGSHATGRPRRSAQNAGAGRAVLCAVRSSSSATRCKAISASRCVWAARSPQLLIERLPATLELAMTAAFIGLMVGIPVGVYTALKRNSVVLQACC